METTTNEKCIICHEDYNHEDRTETKLPCNHSICKSCLFEMCKTKLSCPLCRSDFQVAIQRSSSQTKNVSLEDYFLIINGRLVDMSIKSITFCLLFSFICLNLLHLSSTYMQ